MRAASPRSKVRSKRLLRSSTQGLCASRVCVHWTPLTLLLGSGEKKKAASDGSGCHIVAVAMLASVAPMLLHMSISTDMPTSSSNDAILHVS